MGVHPISDCAASASKKNGWNRLMKPSRTRASFRRGPGGVDDGWVQRYCTSMVMVWLAATSAWSFVAPVTVIWCVPLLRPLKVP